MTDAGLIIAVRLKKARINSGLKQSEVEEQLGYKSSSLSQIENGKKSPNAEDMPTFAKLYNVSLLWLFGVEEYTDEEIELIKNFRKAPDRDKYLMKTIAQKDSFEQTS